MLDQAKWEGRAPLYRATNLIVNQLYWKWETAYIFQNEAPLYNVGKHDIEKNWAPPQLWVNSIESEKQSEAQL